MTGPTDGPRSEPAAVDVDEDTLIRFHGVLYRIDRWTTEVYRSGPGSLKLVLGEWVDLARGKNDGE